MPPRLSMTIMLSGGAALGAYHAGAMSALLVAIGELTSRDEDTVRIEAVGGASAGALVGLFSAHAVLEGIDGRELLHEAWVERVDLSLLRGRDPGSPLSMQRLHSGIQRLLLEDEDRLSTGSYRQATPIAYHVSLTGLQGLTYPIGGLRDGRTISGVSYADWGRFLLQPGAGSEGLFEPEGSSPVDFALASAANPAGFAPLLLDRREDAERYEDHGVSNFPDSGHIWYTDGGLLQSQPLGRVIAAARATYGRDEDRRHITLMIDPRSEGPSAASQWTDPEHAPSWASGLTRALSIIPAQALYEDLRRVAKDNSRLEWASRLVEALEPHLQPGADKALQDLLSTIEEDRGSNRSDDPEIRSRYRGEASDPDRGRLLRRAIDEVAGLVGKEDVHVDLISPLLLAGDGEDVASLLAGDILGDFGGFLERDLRESDFALGYASVSSWVGGALEEAGFESTIAQDVASAVEAGSPGDWRELNRGLADAGGLPIRSKTELTRLALQYAKVLVAEGWRTSAEGLRETVGGIRSRAKDLLTNRREED